jgi:uncharacterized protein YndB with AHSA1/START domain
MGEAKRNHAPIQQSVHVDCPIQDAFRLFTECFGEWWPYSEDCQIEPWPEGRVFELTRNGEEDEIGAVIVWEPPNRVEFTWHPVASRDDDQTVNVEFRVEADGTRVTLTHQGWYRSGEATCASLFAGFVSQQLLVMA